MENGKILENIGNTALISFSLCVVSLVWVFVLKWSWNYVMPYLFNLPTIGWLHAFLLLLIAHSMFPKS